jgi:hypothetical protein
VLAGHADRVAVVYSGEVVEQAGVDDLFKRPSHPYTRGLIASIPNMLEEKERLFSIDGAPPPLGKLPGRLRLPPALPAGQAVLPGHGAGARADFRRPHVSPAISPPGSIGSAGMTATGTHSVGARPDSSGFAVTGG